MTLNKQLWVAVALIILLNSLISFLILFYSTERGIEEQLYLKNIDDANSMALLLTQAEKSEANIRLLLAAKFDAGTYALLRLENAEGEVIDEIAYQGDESTAPSWFQNLVQLDVPRGVAQVSDGWSQFGTIYVESQTSFALDVLWSRFKNFVLSILLLMIGVGAVGSVLLKLILRPLSKIVYQANSFSERRFITIEKPWTTDFAKVVMAMNSLANRFKNIVAEKNERLELARHRAQNDPVTGLPNIGAFFTLLESQLRFTDTNEQHVLIVHSLAQRDGDIQCLSSEGFTLAVKTFAKAVETFYLQTHQLYTDYRIARTNETDVCVLLTECVPLEELFEAFHQQFSLKHDSDFVESGIHCHSAGVYLRADEASYALLDRLDCTLDKVQTMNEDYGVKLESVPEHTLNVVDKKAWAAIFSDVDKNTFLDTQKVKDSADNTLHVQGQLTTHVQQQRKSLSYFTVSARRFGVLHKLDNVLVQCAIAWLKSNPNDICAVLLHQESMIHPRALHRLKKRLSGDANVVNRLCMEFRENAAAMNRQAFRHFCGEVKQFGVQVGLKRVGKSFSQVTDVHEYGLDYIKIDSAYVYDVVNNQSNQSYLRGLTDLAHSLGMKVIADGALSDNDKEVLFSLGFDGASCLTEPNEQ